MLEGERDETAEDLTKSHAGVPVCEARGLLAAGVVLAAEEDQGGRDCGFEGAGEDPDCEEAAVVLEGGVAGCADSPGYEAEAEVVGGGEALEEVDWGRLARGCGLMDEGGRGWVLFGSTATRSAMKKADAALEKLLPVRFRSSERPMTWL